MSKRPAGKRVHRSGKRVCPPPTAKLTPQDVMEDQIMETQEKEAALYSRTPPSLSTGWSSQPFYHDVPELQITGTGSLPVEQRTPATEVVVRSLPSLPPTTAPTVVPPTEVTWDPAAIARAQAARDERTRRELEEMEEEPTQSSGTIPPVELTGRKRPRSQLQDAIDALGSRDLSPQEWEAVVAAERELEKMKRMMPPPVAPAPGVRTIRYRALMFLLQQRMGLWKHIQELHNAIRTLGYQVPRGILSPAYPRTNLTMEEVKAANGFAGRLLRQ